jgi:hypothetical protein
MATVLALAAKISADSSQFSAGLTPAERALKQLDAEVVKVTGVFDKFAGSSESAAAAQQKARGEFAALAGQLQRNQISVSAFSAEFAKLGVAVQAEAEAFARAAAITESVVTPAEKFAAKIAELDAQLEAGRITSETYARATQEVEKEFSNLDRTLTTVEERTGKVANVFSNVGTSFNAVSGAAEGIGSAVRTISEAGSAVVQLGFDIAQATAAFRAFKFITENYSVPQGILGVVLNLGKFVTVIKVAEVVAAQFGADLSGVADAATKASIVFAGFKIGGLVGLDKVLSPTITALGTALPGALARVGVPLVATNAASAALSATFTRLLAFSIPGFGQLAATIYIAAKAFIGSRDTANELASSVAELNQEAVKLGVTFQDLQIQKLLDAGRARDEIAQLGLALSSLDARQLDDLAFANERAAKAANDSQLAIGAVAETISKTFVGAFAAISDGVAGLTEGFTDLVSGVNAIGDPIASVLKPFFTLIGTGVQVVLELVGAIGSVVGAVLRFSGVLLKIGLAPVIVGFNRFADTIRLGVGVAFDWFAEKMDYVQGKITQLQEFFASLPLVGEAFASSQGQVFAAAADGAAQVEVATEDAKKAQEELTRAFDSSDKALDTIIEKSAEFGQAGFDAAYQFQEALADLKQQAAEGDLNAEQYARGVANATAEYEKQIDAVRQVAEETKKAADEAVKKAEGDKKRIEELLNPNDSATKIQQDIAFVIEQQAAAEKELTAARAGSDKEAANSAAARLAQLDQLRSKLEDQSQAIDQGFADGFAKAFDKTNESVSGLIDKAGEFGNAGAEAAVKLQEGIAAAQEQVRDGIIPQEVYDREVANQRKVFEERIAEIEAVRKREKEARDAAANEIFEQQIAANDRVNQFIGQQARDEIAAAEEVAARRQEAAFNIEAIEQRIALERRSLEAAREQNDANASRAAVQRIDALKEALTVEQQIADGRTSELQKQQDLIASQQEFQKQQLSQVEEYQKQQQKAQESYAQRQAKIFEEQQKAAADEAARQEERLAKLNTLGSQTIKSQDVRTAEGASLVLQLAANGQDPALIQQRLQTKYLEAIAAGIGQASSNYFNQPVAIVGYSSFGQR